MVVIVAVSRVMGTEVMGGYAFIVTFISMFSAIGQMGLQALLTREVAADRDKSSSYLSAALLLGLGSSIVLAIAMNGLKVYFDLSPSVSIGVFLMSLNLFPIFVISTFEAVFMGWERTDYILFQNVSGNVLRVALSLLFIHLGFGLVSLVVAIVISTLYSAGVCAYTYARRLGALTLKVDTGVALRLLKASPTFLLITVVAILSARLDVLILTKLTDMTQVALYAAAYKLFEATLIVPQSYMKASFPYLSALFRSTPEAFGRTNRDMLKHVLLYVFPTAAATVALAPLLVSVLYGGKFDQSATLLRILAIGLIPWTMGRTTANILLAVNLQKYDLLCGAFGRCDEHRPQPLDDTALRGDGRRLFERRSLVGLLPLRVVFCRAGGASRSRSRRFGPSGPRRGRSLHGRVDRHARMGLCSLRICLPRRRCPALPQRQHAQAKARKTRQPVYPDIKGVAFREARLPQQLLPIPYRDLHLPRGYRA